MEVIVTTTTTTKPEKPKPKVKKPKTRKSNPDLWKKNVRKTAIAHGKSYQRHDGTIAPPKTIGETCQNCRMKCPDRISREIRQQFFDRYYNISSLSEKRQFILRYVQTVDVKRHRATDSNRKISRTYFIGTGCWENGIESRIQVCQVTFLNTLCISNKVIRCAYERMRSTNGTCFEDLRGKFLRKTSEDVTEKQITLVKDHIKQFPLVDEFIPRMYDLYCDSMRKQSAKAEYYVSIEQYKELYDQELELKLNPPPKKKASAPPKKTIQKVEIIEVTKFDPKFDKIMTLEDYNESIGQQAYYYNAETIESPKIIYVYQKPLGKIELTEDTFIETAPKTVEIEVERPVKKSHAKKSTADPTTWAANRRKNANLHGLSYTKADGTIVPAKFVREFCVNCRMNCQDRVDDNLRQQFFDRYYLLSSVNEKYQFLLRYTQTVDIKSKRTERSKRKISRLYFIGTGEWENGSEVKIQVCQTLFLNTLSISGKTVRTAYEKLWNTNGTSFEDLRGAYNRANKNKRRKNSKVEVTEEDFSTATILANM